MSPRYAKSDYFDEETLARLMAEILGVDIEAEDPRAYLSPELSEVPKILAGIEVPGDNYAEPFEDNSDDMRAESPGGDDLRVLDYTMELGEVGYEFPAGNNSIGFGASLQLVGKGIRSNAVNLGFFTIAYFSESGEPPDRVLRMFDSRIVRITDKGEIILETYP